MLIATLVQFGRQLKIGMANAATRRRDRRARREMEALPPDLLRDIGWPPERHGAPASGQIHHKNRSLTS